MSKISDKQLLGLPVETESGTALGKVHGFHVDVEHHTILQYVVRSTNPLKGLFSRELLVAPSQVLSITEQKMVVDDLVAAEKKRAPATVPTVT